jgi:ATP/maltotriose-dependent transcriptional regulator MalT
VKTARALHDEISEELSEIGNKLDATAGRTAVSPEFRELLRSLRAQVSTLCDLLNGEIPFEDEASKVIFSIEIRREISAVNNTLTRADEGDELLTELRELLNFPKYFLEEGKKVRKLITPLTKREKEVLALLPRGITAKAMASELFLTEATIKSHLAAIYHKFEVVNRTQAIAIAVENKYLAF